MEQKVLKTGTWVLACALAFRLLSGVFAALPLPPDTYRTLGSVFLFLHTGRLPRADPPETETEPPPVQTQPVAATESLSFVFSQADAELVQVSNASGLSIQIQEALLQPLRWQLTQEKPTVMILHTHGTESYVNSEGYRESAAYRTKDIHYNMVSIGARLGERLEAAGIGVLHDTTLYDEASYNGSYDNARLGITAALADNPAICLVLDLHRDAADSTVRQPDSTVSTPKGPAAQLMFVLGTDAGGLQHPHWQENFALAVKLQARLEQLCPGICRPISLRQQRFNQDLSSGALLVEVGATGNTRQEALLAAEYLAQAIASLQDGANAQ